MSWTTTDVAAELGIDESRVRRMAADRGLGYKLGRDWRFSDDDINAMRERAPGRPRKTVAEYRAEMQGNNYPLMSDVIRVMREEGLSQDEAIRAFGVEP